MRAGVRLYAEPDRGDETRQTAQRCNFFQGAFLLAVMECPNMKTKSRSWEELVLVDDNTARERRIQRDSRKKERCVR